MKEKCLNDTSYVANVAVGTGCKYVAQQVRYDGCSSQNVVDTQVAEEQIHGLVEAPLHADKNCQANVGHHDEDV